MSRENEYYPTPRWCVERWLEWPRTLEPGPRVLMVEPCVGDGAIVRSMATHRDGSPRPGFDALCWIVNDFRPASDRLADYGGAEIMEESAACMFSWLPNVVAKHRADFDAVWVVTNPPFSMAYEFVKMALPLVDRVVLHVRQGFMASAGRNKWLTEHTPSMLTIPERPSYDGRGNDMYDVCWLTWGDCVPMHGLVPLSPDWEKKADAELARRLISSLPVVEPPRQGALFVEAPA